MGTILKIVGIVATLAVVIWQFILVNMDEFQAAVEFAGAKVGTVGVEIQANPIPIYIAAATFFGTIVYHRLKGRSLKEAVEFAATRVTVVNAPVTQPGILQVAAVVSRAEARAIKKQLEEDRANLVERQKLLPTDIKEAESEVFNAKTRLIDAETAHIKATRKHNEWVEVLTAFQREHDGIENELAQLNKELGAIQAKI